MTPNRSLERTSTGWPHYAQQLIFASCGQPVSSTQLQRSAAQTRRSGTVTAMPPTIVRDGQFRLFFFSREETRIHVHVAHPEGEAKFWLTPSVHLAKNIGLSDIQLRQAQTVVQAHIQEIQDAWNHHFGG